MQLPYKLYLTQKVNPESLCLAAPTKRTSSSGYTVASPPRNRKNSGPAYAPTSVCKRVAHMAGSQRIIKVAHCVQSLSTYLKGAFDLVATLVSKEDWNQPPSWSFPSRYKSALC